MHRFIDQESQTNKTSYPLVFVDILDLKKNELKRLKKRFHSQNRLRCIKSKSTSENFFADFFCSRRIFRRLFLELRSPLLLVLVLVLTRTFSSSLRLYKTEAAAAEARNRFQTISRRPEIFFFCFPTIGWMEASFRFASLWRRKRSLEIKVGGNFLGGIAHRIKNIEE